MTDRTDVLVVGGSVAGLRTAEALRRFSYPGTVTIHEAGDELPYDRTTLSKKVLAADGHLAQVHLRSRADLDALGIGLCLGSRAESLDAARHTVHFAGGRTVEYGTLVVATGARARELPGVPRTAVHYLRTLADAHRLRTAMGAARRAVVVGAGFIGCEVAAAMSTRGIEVTVVEPAGQPLARVLGDAVAARLGRLHEAHGVRLLPGRAVTAIRAGQVVLDDGAALPADLVVVGVGAAPNTGWLDGSGVEVTDGVVCDGYCRAGTPGVYAVGDVARWPNALFDESMRVEHWTNAVEQATALARNIADPEHPRPYAPVPYVWSDQYGHRLQIVGRPRADDEVRVVEDDPANAVLVALYARAGRLAGACTVNAPARAMALRRSLAAGAPLEHAEVRT